jgi:hypothetical protein
MLAQTHFFFALALGYVLKLPAKMIVIAGVIPDADVIFTSMGTGFPLVHRGFLHTPLILGVILIALYLATKNPAICAGFGAGFLSHLFIDTLNLATYSNVIANYGIIAWSVAFILIFNPHFISYLNPRNLGLRLKGTK